MFSKKLFIALFLSFSLAAISQNNTKLRQSFANGQFEEVLKMSDSILQKDSNDVQATFFKGASLVRLKRYDEAGKYLEKSLGKYQPNVAVQVNLLRLYAGKKQKEKLIKSIEEFSKSGFGFIGLFSNEIFSFVADDKEFQRVKLLVDANANPCKYGEQYKRLDFWLGEWDVYTNNNKTAESSITKSNGGCTLHEDYSTFSGFYGRSVNYYDPSDKLYKQIWIDKFNNIVNFKETKATDAYLELVATSPNGNLTRMSYTLDDKNTVSQRMASSTDKGKTWNQTFLGVYKRKKEKID